MPDASPRGAEAPALPGWTGADEPSAFSFHQLVLLLDRAMPGRPATGADSDPARETARFRALPKLAFPAADIAALGWRERGETDGLVEPRLEATVTFLGLFGPASPLSPHVTEQLLGPDRETLRDFLDVFNHRLIALAYRTWKKYRYYATFEGRAQDDVSRILFGLMGHQRLRALPEDRRDGDDADADADAALDWRRLLRFAGVLGLNCRSPSVVEQVVGAYFGVAARVEEAVLRTVMIPEAQQSRLGARRSTMGSDWVLGGTVQDVAGQFRLWLGPLDPASFRSFLPGGPNHAPLHALIRHLVRDALAFDVWAIPAGQEAAGLSLEADTPLGWASWLGAPQPSVGPGGGAGGVPGVPLPLAGSERQG